MIMLCWVYLYFLDLVNIFLCDGDVGFLVYVIVVNDVKIMFLLYEFEYVMLVFIFGV